MLKAARFLVTARQLSCVKVIMFPQECICSRGDGASTQHALRRGGCLPKGVSLPGGWGWGVCLAGGEGSALPGGGIPECTEADPPSLNRITDACENIKPCPNFVASGNKTSPVYLLLLLCTCASNLALCNKLEQEMTWPHRRLLATNQWT